MRSPSSAGGASERPVNIHPEESPVSWQFCIRRWLLTRRVSLELRRERGDGVPQLLREAALGTNEENDDTARVAWSFLIADGCTSERMGSEFGDVRNGDDEMLAGCPREVSGRREGESDCATRKDLSVGEARGWCVCHSSVRDKSLVHSWIRPRSRVMMAVAILLVVGDAAIVAIASLLIVRNAVTVTIASLLIIGGMTGVYVLHLPILSLAISDGQPWVGRDGGLKGRCRFREQECIDVNPTGETP